MVERDINYKLIEEVEKYPILYNFNLPGYSNKSLIEKAWKEISKKMCLDVPDCKEKWRNVRSSFLRSKKAPKDGSKPKKPYYLAHCLSFVLPYIKKGRNTLDSGISSEEKQQQDSEKDDESDQSQDSDTQKSDDCDDDDSTMQSFSAPSPKHSQTRKRPADEVVDYSVRERKSRNDQDTPLLAPSSHQMHYFFLSLLSEFDSMTESQIRNFKIKVLQFIDDIKSDRDTIGSQFNAYTSPQPSFPAFKSSPQHE